MNSKGIAKRAQRSEKADSGSQAGSMRQPSARKMGQWPERQTRRLPARQSCQPPPAHPGCSRRPRRRSGPRSRTASGPTGRARAGSSPPGSAAPRRCPRSSPARRRSRCWDRSSGLGRRGHRGGTAGKDVSGQLWGPRVTLLLSRSRAAVALALSRPKQQPKAGVEI